MIIIALTCWLGVTLYQAYRSIERGRVDAVDLVYLFMGSQGDTAEWFLRSIYRSEGILTGRLAVMVETERAEDDTARIIEILSKSKGFSWVETGMEPDGGGDFGETAWYFDLRGINTIVLLKKPLNILMAL